MFGSSAVITLVCTLFVAASGAEWFELTLLATIGFAHAALLPGLLAMGPAWPARPWLAARRIFGFAGLAIVFCTIATVSQSLVILLAVPAVIGLGWGLMERVATRRPAR